MEPQDCRLEGVSPFTEIALTHHRFFQKHGIATVRSFDLQNQIKNALGNVPHRVEIAESAIDAQKQSKQRVFALQSTHALIRNRSTLDGGLNIACDRHYREE